MANDVDCNGQSRLEPIVTGGAAAGGTGARVVLETGAPLEANGQRRLEPFRCIVIDSPWPERGSGRVKRGADRHYRVLPVDVLPATILGSGVFNPDPTGCHLYLWATNNYLPDGLWLMRALGFRYVTNIAWAKTGKPGLGQYFRGQHELCLFGVRGRLRSLVRDQRTLIIAARGRHSEKPASFFSAVERVSPGPRLEMFARLPRTGWTCWGDEL